MAVKKTVLCDGSECNTILDEKNGICIRGSIHVVDTKYLDDTNEDKSEGVGGGLIGGNGGVFHYCRHCLAKVLGLDLAVKREVNHLGTHDQVRSKWYDG